jgi:hypothetical protein
METVSYFRLSFRFSKPNKILFTPASLESSELLCPLNVQLIYQLGPSKSSANPIETDNKRSALTFLRNLILDKNKDVTILALLLILLAALSTTTILACMYCRAASKLAGALESHVIHYAAEKICAHLQESFLKHQMKSECWRFQSQLLTLSRKTMRCLPLSLIKAPPPLINVLLISKRKSMCV